MNMISPGVAVVTGASSGIGRATAKALRGAGYRVFGTSRRTAAESIDGVTMLACDVTDDESVAKLVNEVMAKAGRIDLLVNNAGIGLLGGAEESSTAQAQALFDVNVFGVLRVTNAVLPVMRRQKQGRIVNLSSLLGLIPAPYSALYAATKHAVEGYSESLDHELRTLGIRVVLVEPAYTRTSFEENLVRPDRLLDIYDAARDGMNTIMRTAIDAGDAPEIVAKTILEAATATAPKRRYAAGKMARQVSFLRRFVPEFAFDKSLRKQNGLPGLMSASTTSEAGLAIMAISITFSSRL
ncbi:Short-chain dehydrogenase [Bosea sp. OK403]|uniref:oxidoreductase n=1 Tax=Bosea sp. OK403 TaxID=1855286 RepID=UPI0008E8C659|nr:oxidoreductase [Bosea sp. OK403]SFJ71446.1 Short-chain dehydrogenase [Bosea sp. OK403]